MPTPHSRESFQGIPKRMTDAVAASDASAPLLERSKLSGNGGGESRRWRRGGLLLLDFKEARSQILFSVPMVLTNLFYYAIPLVSVMFAGHLGDLSLAGATLANSWATVSGIALMVGLSGAVETLCGQCYGARQYRLLGIYLQASCIISFCLSICVSVLWFYTEPVLILLGQEPDISGSAGLYMKYLIPGLFAYGFINNILRFLQTQSVVLILVVCSMFPLVFHAVIAYALVHWVGLGFIGAPLACSISFWIAFFVLATYVILSKKFEQSWKGFEKDCFNYIITTSKLALPSAAMVCLEYWAFEILVILAGLLPNSKKTTSLIAMCTNAEAVAYVIAYGFSAAASTRVSNELGADCPDSARNAMGVSLKLSLICALLIVSALGLGHNIWAGFFSSNPAIMKSFASMTPLLVISMIFDCVQISLSGLIPDLMVPPLRVLLLFDWLRRLVLGTAGVVRGCGLQHMAVLVNLLTFYLIGVPAACLLAFKFKLNVKGLWMGLICGLCCQMVTLLVVVLRTKWRRLEMPAGSGVQGARPSPIAHQIITLIHQ